MKRKLLLLSVLAICVATLAAGTLAYFSADGYLYCNKAIRPGETTAPLFTCVTFDAGMGNEYQDATATVHVAAEAVQTANNGVTALEALGWPTQG